MCIHLFFKSDLLSLEDKWWVIISVCQFSATLPFKDLEGRMKSILVGFPVLPCHVFLRLENYAEQGHYARSSANHQDRNQAPFPWTLRDTLKPSLNHGPSVTLSIPKTHHADLEYFPMLYEEEKKFKNFKLPATLLDEYANKVC